MSVCIALAFLTRYVGVSLVILGGIVILVSSRGQPVLRRRATDFVVFCLITIVPMLIWLLRGEGHAVGASRLSMLSWHPIPFEKLQEISRTVMYWFLPLRIPLGCAVWLVPLLFVLFGITFFRELTSRFPGSIKGAKWGWRASFVLVSLLFLALYGILLVLAYTFYAASTPWDNRILSPMYLVGLVSALIACASYLDVPNPQRVFISFFMVCVLLGILAINIRRHADWIQTGALEGIGYAHRSWQESRAVAYLLNLPKDVLIVTNNVEAVYLLTGRRAVPLPNKVDPSTLRAVRTRSLSELLERLRGPTVLVFWHKTEVSGYDFSPQELQERMSLSLLRLAEYQDATVYQIEPKQGGIKGAPPYPPRRSREG